jgi:dipeptidyl aminopeptidase/acylaminoacyl peptidase
MTETKLATYGSWKSPISAELIVAETIGLGSIKLDNKNLYWLESRPNEGGRNVIVQLDHNGAMREINAAPFNVRTRVHEYGGGAYLVKDDVVYYINFMDQHIFRQSIGDTISEPVRISQATGAPQSTSRYADGVLDQERNRLICVREDHSDATKEAVNTIAALDLDSGECTTLARGYDFYSTPRLSPDGDQLVWLCWNHPNMPWDGTELYLADLDAAGNVAHSRKIAGGDHDAVFQPEWSPDGTVFFISDRSGWWNLYRFVNGTCEPICTMAAEFGSPHWGFGISNYGFRSADEMICTYSDKGTDYLASIQVNSGQLTIIPTAYTSHGGIQVTEESVYFLAASPSEFSRIVKLELDSGEQQVIKRSSELHLDPGYCASPEAIEFSTEDDLTAHAFYYPPANKDFEAPPGEKPPLLVKIHGGPTAATGSSLSLQIQYWTSRGIGILDVNYGGSTGYGRAYRTRLNGQWGVVDVNDTVNGARFLIDRGDVDADRLAIRGGSAGGYTTLAALTFTDVFKAGASYYGVSDLETLAKDTHKFESRYLDTMVGPYPGDIETYRARSPIHHVDQLSCPIIFFQGLEDKVVPPSQAEAMVEALRRKGLPVAYLPFEGEQHGFRQAENIKRSLDAEFYFYSRVFEFEPADEIEPVTIENM